MEYNHIEKLVLEYLQDTDPCVICRYRFDCNHKSISSYGNGPSYMPCCEGTDYIDKDFTLEFFEENKDEIMEKLEDE